MKDELISVIIPIYNVEKYIYQCINSILNQTYKNIEIILVDDGSPDGCGKICDEYQEKDQRIKVIHKKNGGLSDARNKGMDIAHGKYITFIDSDDYVEDKYIEILYNAIKKNNALISQCNILKVDNNGTILEKIGYKTNQVKSGQEILYDINEGHWIENIVVWNKMYLRELFKNIRFPVGKINEDEFTTYKVLYSQKKIPIVNEYLYNYRQNDESIMGKKFNIKRLNILKAFEERIQFFEKKNDEGLKKLTQKQYNNLLIDMYYKLEENKNINDYIEFQKDILEKYKVNTKNMFNNNALKQKDKTKYIIFYFSPQIYFKLRKILKNNKNTIKNKTKDFRRS